MNGNEMEAGRKVLLFGGTSEGHELARILTGRGQKVVLSVATEYGRDVLEQSLLKSPLLEVRTGRLDLPQMEELIRWGDFGMVIDATHPYADQVSRQIRALCDSLRLPLLRCLRPQEGEFGDMVFSKPEEAARWLSGQEGNVLLTTGSKELAAFCGMKDFESRVYARILPMEASLKACLEVGLKGRHIIAMQGPFSVETNVSQLREFDCRFLVTKHTGLQGGYEEKVQAARQSGACLVVIGRPSKEEGLTLNETLEAWEAWRGLKRQPRVRIVGAGMGDLSGLTGQARKTIRQGEALMGAKRILEGVRALNPDCPALETYKPEEMVRWLEEFSWQEAVVVMSGDVGFYSGAWAAGEAFSQKGWQVEYIPGISCLSWFSAAIGRPWQKMAVLSCHGRDADGVEWIRRHPLSFLLLGEPERLLLRLVQEGMEDCRLWIGENFTGAGQRIEEGCCGELLNLHRQKPFGPLSCLIAENPAPKVGNEAVCGLPDAAFVRGRVPMTKGEIRAISMAKLGLTSGAVCYDIGSGTGSVSVEMGRALMAAGTGSVYAVEYRPEALKLTRENGEKFLGGWQGFHVIEGRAPQALWELPAPTHAFLGGTGGSLFEIVECLLKKNPQVRIVANAITPQTVAGLLECRSRFVFSRWEMVQAAVTAYEPAGEHLMPKAGNPVYIVVMEQAGEMEEKDCTG